MISIFAAPVLIACLFCLLGWLYLTVKNATNYRLIFSLACMISAIAYGLGFVEYVYIFYVDKTPQMDKPMYFLFIRMLCHVTTVLIFCYRFKHSISK